MATIASDLNTEFVPAASPFRVQVTGGSASLQSAPAAGGTYVGGMLFPQITGAVVVDNPVTGTAYKLIPVNGSPVVTVTQ